MGINRRIGKRKTSWIVDYRDASGKRRYIACRTKADAERVLAGKNQDRGGNPHITFGEVAKRWLLLVGSRVRARTHKLYETDLRNHISPAFERSRITKLFPTDLELFLAEKLKAGMAPATVSRLQSTLLGVLGHAVRDGLIRGNPASGLGRSLGLRHHRRDKETQAFTPAELEIFLEAARECYPHLYACFLTMARTGLRIGEAVACRWEDVDLKGTLYQGETIHQITVRRTLHPNGTLGPTKTGAVRRVDMSRGLREELERHYQAYLEEHLRSGRTTEDWVFRHPAGKYLRTDTMSKQFKLILAAAGLPKHFHPHSLRHTFAAIHILLGTSLPYLKEQLGHSTIQMTVDIYGHWFAKTNPEAANRLDSAARDRIDRARDLL